MSPSPSPPGRASEALFDVVAPGEVMLRLASRPPTRLEQARELDVSYGGTEANVLCALARLGHRTAWISALPANVWGERLARELRGHGVDVGHVAWREGGRIGTYFIEYGVAPRPIRVVYDRQDSAFASLDESEVDWATVSRARVVHVTGITAALGPRPRRLFERAVESARGSGALLSLDVNHRTALWTHEAAGAYLTPVLESVGLLFVGIEDARRVFQLAGEPEVVAASLRRLAPGAIVALTLGDQGSVVLTDRPRRPTRLYSLDHVADRVGAGDAFAAGFLHGWLTTGDAQRAQDLGTALAALKCTMWGDIAVIRPGELEELLTQPDPRIRR